MVHCHNKPCLFKIQIKNDLQNILILHTHMAVPVKAVLWYIPCKPFKRCFCFVLLFLVVFPAVSQKMGRWIPLTTIVVAKSSPHHCPRHCLFLLSIFSHFVMVVVAGNLLHGIVCSCQLGGGGGGVACPLLFVVKKTTSIIIIIEKKENILSQMI